MTGRATLLGRALLLATCLALPLAGCAIDTDDDTPDVNIRTERPADAPDVNITVERDTAPAPKTDIDIHTESKTAPQPDSGSDTTDDAAPNP